MSKISIVSSVFWTLCERISAQFISFVVSIILARILSPNDYGEISIILIFIAIADVLTSNGFGAALIQEKNAETDDFSTIFFCSSAVSIIIYFILFISAPSIAKFFGNPKISILLRVLAIKLPISAYNTIQKAYISRNMMFKKFFFVTLIGTAISAIVGIWMAIKGAGAWSLIVQYLTNCVIDSISLTFVVDWKPRLIFNKERARKLLSYGWKVSLAELIGTSFDQLQSLTVGKVFSPSDLAYYNKGNQIPSMLSININSSVMTVLFPAIANKGNNYSDIKAMTRKAIRMMIYIVFPMMFGLALVSRPLIIILLTEKWSDSIQYMSVLCFSVAFTLVANTGLQTIKAMGRSDLLLIFELLTKPVFLIALYIGLQHGVLGVALSSTIYSSYTMIIAFGIVGKIINYPFIEQIKDLIDVSKITILMSIFVLCTDFFYFRNNILELFVKVLIGAGSYLLISKSVNSEEFDFIIYSLKSYKLIS